MSLKQGRSEVGFGDIYRYAYEYRNPQGLVMLLDEMNISKREAEDILEEGLGSYTGHKGPQYNYMAGDYQTLPEWIRWFLKNEESIRRGLTR